MYKNKNKYVYVSYITFPSPKITETPPIHHHSPGTAERAFRANREDIDIDIRYRERHVT